MELVYRSGHQWRVTAASYKNEAGETIDLLNPYETRKLIPPQLASINMSANAKPKGVAILGSTGSIGCNTLRVIESLGGEQFRMVALGAGHNVEVLADQIAKHLPELVSVETEEVAHDLRARLFERNVDLAAHRRW